MVRSNPKAHGNPGAAMKPPGLRLSSVAASTSSELV
jgi:hypothetical protein